jgi:hypothetical protein
MATPTVNEAFNAAPCDLQKERPVAWTRHTKIIVAANAAFTALLVVAAFCCPVPAPVAMRNVPAAAADPPSAVGGNHTEVCLWVTRFCVDAALLCHGGRTTPARPPA